MYYENFEKLCKTNKVKPGTVSKATGISTATLTSWKQGKYTPKQDKLQIIANYFDVSIDYLMTGEDGKMLLFETAKQDAALSNMDDIVKAYALKLNELPEDKRNLIFNMIEQLEK